MKNILISGVNGFVGTNLKHYLEDHAYNICSLSQTKTNSFTWHDLPALKNQNIDAYIHLAGKAHDTKNIVTTEAYFDINTRLTQKLFDCFLQSTATIFIFISSVKAAADKVDNVLYEDVNTNPQTAYGQSKQLAEEYLLAQTLPLHKKLFILRPCMIHGPGNKGNLNLLYKFVLTGLPYPLAAFNNRRSFLSVSNLSFVIEKLISIPSIINGIYNVADDIPLSTNQVIEIIATTSKLKLRLWKVNAALIKSIAQIGNLLYLPINTSKLKKLTENYIVSNKKIKTALNIPQLPLSSEDGLKLTIQSFHSN